MLRAGAIMLASAYLGLPAPATAALPTGPSSCTAKEVRAALVSFARALNRGDYETLDAVFAEKPDFQWYTTDGRSGREAKRRDDLIAYFRRRHGRGERLGLKRYRFTGNSPHYGNFEMTMRRSLPGVRGGRWLPAPGKGAAVCAEGETRLIVVSFGSLTGV